MRTSRPVQGSSSRSLAARSCLRLRLVRGTKQAMNTLRFSAGGSDLGILLDRGAAGKFRMSVDEKGCDVVPAVDQDDEEEFCSQRTRKMLEPNLPSQAEQEEHSLTHFPHRNWCRHCARGRCSRARTLPPESSAERRRNTTGLLLPR